MASMTMVRPGLERVAPEGVFGRAVLHLAPGIGSAAVSAALIPFVTRLGWPPAMAMLLAWPLAGIPLEPSLLRYEAPKRNGP